MAEATFLISSLFVFDGLCCLECVPLDFCTLGSVAVLLEVLGFLGTLGGAALWWMSDVGDVLVDGT